LYSHLDDACNAMGTALFWSDDSDESVFPLNLACEGESTDGPEEHEDEGNPREEPRRLPPVDNVRVDNLAVGG
jgi:hypothetical protein